MADIDLAVDALSRQMIELQVMDTVRSDDSSSMPAIRLSHRFDMLSTKVAKCKSNWSFHERNREMIAHFGCPPIVMAKVWELMRKYETISDKAKEKHLLWALHCLKEYPAFRVMCSTVKMDEDKFKPDDNTLCKWVWHVIEAIADLQDEVIVWENRFENDRGNSCLVGVDCKDMKFQQILVPDANRHGKMKVNKALFSEKLNGPGLRYEIASCLLSNDIVWINGPFLPGDWNDITIFRSGLKHKLEEAGERAEADGGCQGEAPDFIVCNMSAELLGSDEKAQFNKRAQGRIEAINRHLTHWKCLSNKFVAKGTPDEKVEKHRIMFTACIVLKQIGMNLGVGELHKMGHEYTS